MDNEEFDLKEIIVTWICYSVVLICSFLIYEIIHKTIGVEDKFFCTFSIVVYTQILIIK